MAVEAPIFQRVKQGIEVDVNTDEYLPLLGTLVTVNMFLYFVSQVICCFGSTAYTVLQQAFTKLHM